jgi:hypothetical protein
MKKLTVPAHIFAVCLLLLAATSIAQAQATRTWVSGVGDDVNPCSRTAPCKTFAGAISKTATCGEISVLDPGGFGAVTITKSITINGEGTLAGILAALTTGVIVNAAATSTVYLKNLEIDGGCNGIDGIRFIAGSSLLVEKCRIWAFTNFGINVNKTAAGFLSVTNTTINNCIGGGIVSATSAGTIRADIDNTKVFGCTNGFKAGANSMLTIKSSTASGCGTAGFIASGATAVLNMDSCVATHNGNGVRVETSGVARIAQSTISNNITKGLDNGGGTIESYQDNYLRGNPNSDAPSPFGKG